MQLIESFSAPGDPARPNEDAWAAEPHVAVVLDGATGLGGRLMEADSDAAWLARTAAERLAAHAHGLGGRDLLRAALAEVEAAFLAGRARPPVEPYELPMASMMLLRPVPGGLAAAWYGDCLALVKRPGEAVEVIGDALETRAAETGRAAELAAAQGIHPAGALGRPEFLADRRAERNARNREGCQWTLAPDAACADHARHALVSAPPGTLVLLASDGFGVLISDYGLYDPQSLMAAALSRGLAPLYDELRAVEADDPHGARYPRFKTGDDATALLLRIGAGGG